MTTIKYLSLLRAAHLLVVLGLIQVTIACHETRPLQNDICPLGLDMLGMGIAQRGFLTHEGHCPLNGDLDECTMSGLKDSRTFLVEGESRQGHQIGVTSPNYEVRSSPGKGFGTFATRPIAQGQLIFTEEALFAIPLPEIIPGKGSLLSDMLLSLETAFANLTATQKAAYLALHEHRFPNEPDQSKLITVFRSNAYNSARDRVGIFMKMARINHSCRPNAGTAWVEEGDAGGRKVVFANRDIKADEEIVLSYIPLLMTRSERGERLAQYGFSCACEACMDPGSDEKRSGMAKEMSSLENQLKAMTNSGVLNDRLVKRAVELSRMMEAEGLTEYLARCYHLVAEYNRRAKHIQEARRWAQKSLEVTQYGEVISRESRAVAAMIDHLDKESEKQ